MKYNVGDKVRIKSIDWYNKNKDSNGNVVFSSKVTHFSWCENVRTVFTKDMAKFCGKVVTIETVWTANYSIVEGTYRDGISIDYFTDEMIEGLVEEDVDLIPKFGEFSDNEPLDIPTMTTDFIKEHGLPCPEEYVFKDENGNVINATKIVLEKKNIIREEQIDNAAQEYIDSDNAVLTYSDGFCEQTDHPFVRAAFKAGVEWADNNVTQDDCSKAPKLTSQDYSNGRFGYRLPAGFEAKLTERELILTPEKPKYPKTYEECCKVIGYALEGETIIGYKTPLLRSLQKLLICRDAYWKIAGEEIGLGKPWKPDWKDGNQKKYCIYNDSGDIKKGGWYFCNAVLAFPTAEMRDAFYENFKKEIEQCKELL